jgi:pectate lyase
LHKSIHHKGPHGYGALIRGCYGAKYTYHHNLFAHNYSRNPRPGNYDQNNRNLDPEGLLFDFRNNVMYNWGGSRPGYDADKESVCHYNYVGNYGKPGPDSDKAGFAYNAGCKYFKAFFSGNWFYGNIPADQWSLVDFGKGWTPDELKAYKQDVPFNAGPITIETAQDAFKKVLNSGGASIARDAVDARVVNDVIKGTGKIIGNEAVVGGWPEYKTYGVKPDTDGDGMPDQWEMKKGMNPNDPDDRNSDKNKDGYTALEEYLNSLVMQH